MKRPLAFSLSALLVLLSPGMPAYQAAAQTTAGSAASQSGNAGVGGQVGSQTGAAGTVSAVPLQVGTLSLQANPLASVSGAPVALPGAISAAGVASALPASVPSAVPAKSAPSVTAVAPAAVAAVSPALSPTTVKPLASPLAAAKSPSAASEKTVTGVLKSAAKQLAAPEAKSEEVLGALYENSVRKGGEAGAVKAGASAPGSFLKKSASSEKKSAASGSAVPGTEAAAATAKPGLVSRLRSLFDLSMFNKSEKSYILGQAVFLFAISVYLASLPLLVKSLTGDAAMTGVARMVHYWVFGGASLFAGAIVARNPMKRILVGAAGIRAALFGGIGVLTLFGALPWTGFLFLVGVNSLIVAHNHLVDIDTGGAAKIFQDGEAVIKGEKKKVTADEKIEKAGYVYDFIYYGMMLVVPALIGLPMDWLDGRFGPGIGAAVGFTLFAALMAVVSMIYAKRVNVLGEGGAPAPAAMRVAAGLLGRLATPFVKAYEAALWTGSVLKTFAGIVRDTPKRLWSTAKIILGNKAILARSSMATVENFVEDALFAVVLPTFAIDMLKAGAFGNGLLLGAITAGGLVASMFLMKRIQALQQRHGTYKVLAALSVIASLAFIPSVGLWLVPSLALALPAVFMMKLMLQPLRSRMRALLQTEIKNDPKAAPHADEIYSLMTFVEVLAAGAGGLAFSWLFHNSMPGTAIAGLLGAMAPMKVVTIAMVGMGLVYLGGLRWVKSQLAKPTFKTFKSPEGNEAKMLAQLSQSLSENGLPDFKTETRPGGDSRRPTVAILAPASRHKTAIAREGGRQSAGDVHLVLDSSWLTQERYPDGSTKLLLKKGVTFDEKGQATVVEYETPLRVRYFADYFTLGANDRDDGVPLEDNLDVPQSNSLQLEKIVNDKLGTRLMMAARGVAVPATLALLMPAHHLSAQAGQFQASSSAGVSAVAMPTGDDKAAEVSRMVGEFLDGYEGEEIVVKPSGPQFHSGRGVKFFKKSERSAIIAHALALSMDPMMTQDGAVLVDSRVNSAPLDRAGRKMETTLRVLAARAPWDGGVTTGIFARVGPWGKPTTAEAADPRDNATVEPWADLLAEWKKAGLLDEGTARDLDAQVREMGGAAIEAIAAGEKSRARKEGEPYQAQTDLIGLDVMIERRGDKLVPVVIEVNDHDSGGQYNLDKMHPERVGEHSREWVATMLQRARRDALKGKRVVLVGAGYAGKRFIFERAKALGVDIVLVDARTPFVSELIRDGLVAELIETDNSKPKEALAAAKKKLQKSIKRDGDIDGITSFWEDDVPLTADLAQALGLPYHTQSAAKSVRSKAETRAVMEKAGLPAPRHRKISLPVKKGQGGADYDKAVSAARQQLAAALDFVGYPAVLKPAFGAAAMGVKKVHNTAEALAAFDEIRAVVTPEVDPIFAQGADLVLEQYLDGREYDVDIVMRGGKPLFVSVTDNWPTREPYFLATGSSLPTRRLNKKEETEAGDLAVRTAQALGLTDGVIHIEGKYTSDGARIVEANGRMGGEYVHDWVEAVWGVSLVEEGLMAATGIQGTPFKAAKPLTHLEGEFLIPQQSGVIDAFDLPASAREQPGFHELRIKKRVGDRIAVPPVGYERAGMLVARGADKDEAQRNLDALRAKLLLHIKRD